MASLPRMESFHPPEPASVAPPPVAPAAPPPVAPPAAGPVDPPPPPLVSPLKKRKSAPASIAAVPEPIPPHRRALIRALRYVISAPEYAVLRRRVLSRSPAVARRVPTVSEFANVASERHPDEDVKRDVDFTPAASRAALRLLVVSYVAQKGWDALMRVLARRRGKPMPAAEPKGFHIRSSVSVALLLLLHRLLYRFFARLRVNLTLPQARAFRVKHRRVSRAFLSPFAPAVGASLAGAALAVHPSGERRITAAVWMFVKACESLWNVAEAEGRIDRPWWFGSWMLFPLATGQLMYAFVFERDCFPQEWAGVFERWSGPYLADCPAEYPLELPWPSKEDIVSSAAAVSKANYPPFNSPILYPSSPSLPSSLPAVAPLLSRAHPALRSLHCALLHPSTPSCALQLGEFSLATFPQLLRIASILYAATTVLRTPRAVLSAPITAIARTAVSAVRTSAWLTAAIGTAWAATCAIQHAPFPRALLLPAAARWWAAGAIAGCWAGAESGGRGAWLYALRLALVSAWGVARKRHVVGKWKGVDVAVFVAALAVIGAVFERDPQAVGGSAIRAVLVRLRGKRREELPRERGRGREKGKGGKRPEERSSGELVKTAVEKARKKM